MTRASNAAVVLALGLAPALAPAVAAQEPEAGEFRLVQSGAVIATETFSRSAGRLATELTVTGQGTLRTQASIRPDATVGRLEMRVFADGATGEPVQTAAVVFRDGTAAFEDPIGTPAASPLDVDSGAVPYINPSPSYMEQIVRRGRVIGGDTVEVPIWTPAPGRGEVVVGTLAFGRDTATLTVAGVTIEITTDAVGRLLSARVPSQALVIERR